MAFMAIIRGFRAIILHTFRETLNPKPYRLRHPDKATSALLPYAAMRDRLDPDLRLPIRMFKGLGFRV